MMRLLCIALCVFIVDGVFSENTDEDILCAMSGSIAHIAEDGAPEQIPAEPSRCKKTNYCYTLWIEHPNNGSVEIMGQGE